MSSRVCDKLREYGSVVLLSHEYPPYTFGGVAVFSKQIAERLSNNCWRVYVISGNISRVKRINLEKFSNNLIIVRIYFPEIPPRWLIYTFLARIYVEKILSNSNRKIIILSNNPLTWLVLKDLMPQKNLQAVLTVFHGSLYSLLTFYRYISLRDLNNLSLEDILYYSEAPLINYLTKKDLYISDRYIFIANHVLREYELLYKDMSRDIERKSVVIYPGIEYEYLKKLRESVKKIDKDKTIIAYVGRLYYTKGITYAIKAIESLLEMGYKDFELWIFGKGPLENWLKKYVKRKKLSRYIRHFGFIERPRLLTLLAKYVDILLHPSLYEGAPIAVTEAQALGIPAITFNLPWTQEFIIDGINGYKATYPNTFELAKILIKAVNLNAFIIVGHAKKYDINTSLLNLINLLDIIIYEGR